MTSKDLISVVAVIESDHMNFSMLAVLDRTNKTLHLKNLDHDTMSALSNAKMRYVLELTESEPIDDEPTQWYGTGSPIEIVAKNEITMLTNVIPVH